MTKQSQETMIIQTGPLTSPEPLLRDLEAIEGIDLTVQRLGTSFRAGGVAVFITITTTNDQLGPLAEAFHEHTKRLNARGGDDLVYLVEGEIGNDADQIAFRDVRCRRQVSLKDRSADEIKEVLLRGDDA